MTNKLHANHLTNYYIKIISAKWHNLMTLYYEQPKIKAHASTKKITLMNICVERLTRASFFDAIHSYKKRQKTVFPLKQLSALLFLSILSYGVEAADWYVRAGAGGNGTSWTSAWSNVTNINWSSINPGDSIWIAGGTYGSLTVGKSGSADTTAGRIFIKRATSTSHGSDAGWNSTYNSQVKLASISWNSTNVGSYVTIDGQVDRGIYIQTSGNGAAVSFDRGVIYPTLRYLDLAGPCSGNNCAYGGDNRSIDITASNNGSYELVDHLLVQHNKLHGTCTIVWNYNADNAIYEYNEFYDNNAASDPNVCHTNIIAAASSSNVTFRYNNVHDYGVEGIMMLDGTNGAWYVYGNIWNGGKSGSDANRVLESQDGTNGPIYVYNNTMVDIAMTVRTANNGTWASGSAEANNIYWNTSPGLSGSDYNFCSGTCSGAHSISNGANPFVNYTNGDFHLISSVGATYPKDKGSSLGSSYAGDMDGAIRGNDGKWDIGVYEFTGTNTAVINPPQNLRLN